MCIRDSPATEYRPDLPSWVPRRPGRDGAVLPGALSGLSSQRLVVIGRRAAYQLAHKYWRTAERITSETLVRSSAARRSRSCLRSGSRRTDSTVEAAEERTSV